MLDFTRSNENRTVEGAMIAFCGVVLTVFGLNYMKHAGQGEWKPWRMRTSQAPLWGLAFFSWGFGQSLQVIGLWLAPESVVATVANAATVVNAVVASRLFGEPFRLRPPLHGTAVDWCCNWDLLAVLQLTLGACLVVVSAPSLEVESYSAADEAGILTGRPFGVAIGVSVAAGGAAAARIAVERRDANTGRLPPSPGVGLSFGALAGVTGALSFTATKLWLLLANSSLAGNTSEAWRHPVGWATLLIAATTTFANMVALFAGMASQEALVVIPAYYIVQTVLTAVQELALFSLYPELLIEPRQCVLFLLGIALCVWGVSATGYRQQPAGAGQRPAQLLDADVRWTLESLPEGRAETEVPLRSAAEPLEPVSEHPQPAEVTSGTRASAGAGGAGAAGPGAGTSASAACSPDASRASGGGSK